MYHVACMVRQILYGKDKHGLLERRVEQKIWELVAGVWGRLRNGLLRSL